MRSMEVLAASYDAATGRIVVVKEITNDDGSTELNAHAFPPELFEWLAATYDITDPDELVDVVLYEPFVRHDDALALTLEEARASCRTKTSQAKALYGQRSRSRALARSTLRSRGVSDILAARVDEEPYQVIKSHAFTDPEVIAVQRAYVTRQREERQRNTGTTSLGMSRAEQVKSQLDRKDTSQRPSAQTETSSTLGELPTVVLKKGRRAH